ncbi:MAG: RICIN domain-containing protein [Anaerolineae bacterium]|nr:RICIN domain-containing protein [Anaerolineae bacterium]
MPGETKLDDIALEELLQELREREQPKLTEAMGAPDDQSPLVDFETEKIVENVQDRQKVIYGVDNRQDLFNVADPAIQRSADSVVSLWNASNVVDNGNGTSTLVTQNFGTSRNLCSSEPFRNQPIGAFCTGFLVAPDIIATAGHCVDAGDVTNTRFVFGYRMTNAANAQTVINNREIYRGVGLVGRELTTGGADWCLVRLDRRVPNHRVVPIRRAGAIPNNQAVYVIGHPVGLPIKYAPGANVRDNSPAAFFVANLDTYGGNSGSPVFNASTHEVEGILVRGENDFVMNGSCRVSLVCPNTGCRGEDCTRTTEFSSLVPTSLNLPGFGTYTIQQRSNNRFLDAHESSANDFSAVTRPPQNNNTQRWMLTPIGTVYTIQQRSNNRFLDAHESGEDFSVVTRSAQNNASQKWVLFPSSGGTYTIQQLVNGRYMDAHEAQTNDFSVVTRPIQNNDTQRWILTSLGNNTYTIQQRSNNRFLDAHESSTNDFSAVTRPPQNNNTQRWVLTPVGGVYTIQQRSNNRFLDAHESSGNDFSAVTRSAQNNASQRWVLLPSSNGTYTIQHLVNGRYLDAHEAQTNDFSAVTRKEQNNDTQRWIINPV